MTALPLAAFVLMGLFWGAWAALVPAVQIRTGATPPELGAALLWAGAGALPAMLLTGRLWARLGSRLVGLTLLLFGVAALGPVLAPSVVALAGSLALVGAASGALDVAMNSQISEIEERSGRRLMYLAHALFSLAVLVAAVTVGVARGTGADPVLIVAPLSLAFVVVAALSMLTRRGVQPARTMEMPGGPASARPVARASLILLGLLCAAAFLIEDALVSWGALHMERSLGAGPELGGAGPGLFAGAMFVGRSAGQVVARRFSDRAVMTGAGLVTAAGIALAAMANEPLFALLGLIIAGLGVSLVAPALFGRAGRTAAARSRGAAIAGLTVFGYTGFIVGPPVVGAIAGLTDLRTSFLALAGLALALAVVSRLSLRGGAGAPEMEAPPPVTRA